MTSKDDLENLLDSMLMETIGHPDDEAHACRFAKLEATINRLRECIANGDVYGVALAAMDVHYRYDQIAFQRGERTTTAFKAARSREDANDAKEEKAAATASAIRAEVTKKVKASHGHLSITAAGQRVADDHVGERGWSWGTVKEAIKGMGKPKK